MEPISIHKRRNPNLILRASQTITRTITHGEKRGQKMTISAPLNISATTMIKGKPVEIKSNPGKMRSTIGPRMDMAYTR